MNLVTVVVWTVVRRPVSNLRWHLLFLFLSFFVQDLLDALKLVNGQIGDQVPDSLELGVLLDLVVEQTPHCVHLVGQSWSQAVIETEIGELELQELRIKLVVDPELDFRLLMVAVGVAWSP